MQFRRCALGVIQQRGHDQIAPQSMQLGADEAKYFARHVEAVRRYTSGSSVASVAPGGLVLSHMRSLASTQDDDEYEQLSTRLQDALAQSMQSAGNAKDCVFAVLRFSDDVPTPETHITVLKLDAIIEAAQWQVLKDKKMDFRVLTDLLPEPGNLQKGLSWPDPRPDSEVITIDRNSVNAQYFERAFGLLVSPRAKDAEAELLQSIADNVPAAAVAGAMSSIKTDAPLTDVFDDLAQRHPELSQIAEDRRRDPRPSGRIRAESMAGRPLIWEADGIQVKVPAALFDRVVREETADGEWRILVRVKTEPKLRPG